MKAHAQMKIRGPSRVNAGQANFELRQKVVFALNKLSDRDTCQIGVDELEKIAQFLTPDGIAPFLSCILNTDKEQKSGVRKECIRLMGVLVNFHKSQIGSHVGKMVATIVKRLRDPDSVVRDACVETMGVMAAILSNIGDEKGGVFVLLVKPLFEALGEQNKQTQSGSAMCLARVIDNTHDPPVLILQRMLTRTIKLLKNPHFMAKPAVIELNRSIVQAGGAPSQNVLSAAITSIQEALKNSDWTTRKASSAALAEIASTGGSWLGSFKRSCISSLESCRFDKVKPVRDTVLHALQCWKSLPGLDTPEHSETGSSIKENFCRGDYSDLTSTGDSLRNDVTPNKVVTDSAKRRIPLSIKKTSQDYMDNQHSKADEWQIEIAIPKSHNASLACLCNEDSEGSTVTRTLERLGSDITSTADNRFECVTVDDKREDYSSASNLVTDNFETKFVTVSHDLPKEGSFPRSMRRNQQFSADGTNSEERRQFAKMRNRVSLDSTVTETSFQPSHGCCSQVASEMSCIQKQLLEIENKQSDLMELLQVFSTGIMDSLSMLKSKVSVLEHEVDKIAHALPQGGRNSDSAISKLVENNVSSPRISTSTPRPSVDIHSRKPPLISAKNSYIWEEKMVGKIRSTNSARYGTEICSNPTMHRTATTKEAHKTSGHGTSTINWTKRVDSVLASIPSVNARENGPDNNNCLRQRVKGFLCKGDLDSAYVEALSSVDEPVLIELLDRTGPVLESLSHKTVSDILSTLASYFLEQRFINSLIPWLQQVVDLSTNYGPDYFVLSAKVRREFLSAIQESVNMEFWNPTERRSVTKLAMRLCQLWGKAVRELQM